MILNDDRFMENTIVSIKHLSQRYGTRWAVKDLSMDIPAHGITGLLGANGAGKSTTMNMICGVLSPTEGEVWINGINLKEHPEEARKFIGFLPQQPPVYGDLTVEEYLTHCAYLRLMPPSQVKEAVVEAMRICSIGHFAKRLIKSLSGGYQQRVGIAQAIVHRPPLVVLDEPTNGLDPNQIVDVRNLIRDLARQHAVLLSTHILPEVEATCQEIRMIRAGELVFTGSMDEFNNYIAPTGFEVEFMRQVEPETVRTMLAGAGEANVEAVGPTRYKVVTERCVEVSRHILKESVTCGLPVRELVVGHCSLNEIFARLSGEVVRV